MVPKTKCRGFSFVGLFVFLSTMIRFMNGDINGDVSSTRLHQVPFWFTFYHVTRGETEVAEKQ